MRFALRHHWPEYLMEAAGLGLFMVSAGLFGTLLEYPASPVRQALPDPFVRRVIMGAAMGLTALGLIYYPWGKQSGAHYNPAVTLTFLRLGKIKPADAFFYVAAQFVGGTAGVLLVAALVGAPFADSAVNYVATVPGPSGAVAAFVAEAAIAGLLMLVVVLAIGDPRLMRFTGMFAGLLIAVYITFEAPFSGMSINPARTVASALPAGNWTAWWVYFVAPPMGMLLAAELHRLITQQGHAGCAKLNHTADRRCIFCGYGMKPAAQDAAADCNRPSVETSNASVQA